MGTGSGEPQEPSSAVPADFKWETTRDLDISVGMPSVTGSAPQYAVIRVYSSPILSDGNIVAMGVVTPSRPVFETAVTIMSRPPCPTVRWPSPWNRSQRR